MKKYILLLTFFLIIINLLSITQCIPKDFQSLFSDAQNYESFMKDFKNQMHAIPEPSASEKLTSSLISRELKKIGATITIGWASSYSQIDDGYGVVAQFGNGKSPCVGVVVGIDAPSINDNTLQNSNSTYNHMNGNDINTAILLGTAKILKRYESELEGTVKLIFQPKHENGQGASLMIKEGLLLQSPKINILYALQIDTKYEAGRIITRPGVFTAYKQDFKLTINGESGHIVPQKYQAIDALPPLVNILTKFSHFFAREIPPGKLDQFAYISTGNIQCDSTLSNIVTGKTILTGSVFAFSELALERTITEIKNTLSKVGESYDCITTFEKDDSIIQPVINDQDTFDIFSKVVESAGKSINTKDPELLFSEYSKYFKSVPGLLILLGAGGQNYSSSYSPYFTADESIYPDGASLLSNTIFQSLKDLKNKNFNIKDEL